MNVLVPAAFLGANVMLMVIGAASGDSFMFISSMVGAAFSLAWMFLRMGQD